MNKVSRLTLSFALAFVVTYFFASIAHTQLVLNRLVDIGVMMSMSVRVDSTLKDLMGLLPGYGSVIAIALLFAFVIVSTFRNHFKMLGQRITYWMYPLGGFLAIFLAHLLMKPIFDITLIAGARGFWGLLLQCLAGALGGIVYAASVKTLRKYRMREKRKHRSR